jgi:8-oxo-dGTP pyrophosphatase MutT (NUDIX family)
VLKPWRVLRSTVTFQDRWLTVRSDTCQTSRGQTIEPYHVVEYPPWVNVVALTPYNQIVLVRQYRHGVGKILLGLPCGVVDSNDPSPAHAAVRELEEETGYIGDPPCLVETFSANPATQNNMVSTCLILNARPAGQILIEPGEEIETVLMDSIEFLKGVVCGSISLQASHSCAVLRSWPSILKQLSGDDQGLWNELVRDIFYDAPNGPPGRP